SSRPYSHSSCGRVWSPTGNSSRSGRSIARASAESVLGERGLDLDLVFELVADLRAGLSELVPEILGLLGGDDAAQVLVERALTERDREHHVGDDGERDQPVNESQRAEDHALSRLRP